MSKNNIQRNISIIGNNNSGGAISDGGRIKIRLFQSLLNEEGFKASIIDLNNWKMRFFAIIRKIKAAMKQKETIVIMAGPNGSRLIIPIIYKFNKKYKTRIVFCPVGIGTIDKVVKGFSKHELNDFLLCNDFHNKRDKKFSRFLSSFDKVVLENKVLENCYKNFYGINNTGVLTNFRVYNEEIIKINSQKNDNLRCIYLSRVCLEKGILDLVECVNDINKSSASKIELDIYGDIQLSNENDLYYQTNDYVRYKGVANQKDCYRLISNYDLFILPTKYHGEGTPGSLVESLISGTPVLVSNYSQSKELIKEGYNGYLFEMDSLTDLKDKLIMILEDKRALESMRANVLESSKNYIYKYIRDDFLKMIGGVGE